jgi:hypothetical protein
LGKLIGRGTKQDIENGKQLIQKSLLNGDRHWTFDHVMGLEYGSNGFKRDKESAKLLFEISESQNMSDCSLFRPDLFDLLVEQKNHEKLNGFHF